MIGYLVSIKTDTNKVAKIKGSSFFDDPVAMLKCLEANKDKSYVVFEIDTSSGVEPIRMYVVQLKKLAKTHGVVI